MLFAPCKEGLTLIAKPSRIMLRFNKVLLSSISKDKQVLNDPELFNQAVETYQKEGLFGIKESLQYYGFESLN